MTRKSAAPFVALAALACAMALPSPALAQDKAPAAVADIPAHPTGPAFPPAFLRAMKPMVERDAATDRVFTRHHVATIGARHIAYDAIATETPVKNAAGQVAAVLVTYAYVASGKDADPKRPVLFIFNGGPGASSSPLHLEAFGPERIVGEGTQAKLVDNPYSLLDVADLVFVDPPGTGASMPVKGADPASLFSVAGDASAVAYAVDAWRTANGRTQSPFALVGESYGTSRALAMLGAEMEAKEQLPSGVALLSLALGGTSGPILSNLVDFPTFATVAWYHNRVDRSGRSVEQQYLAALTFAQDTYLPALVKGPHLSETERMTVARQMSDFIGIDAKTLAANDLQIDPMQFMTTVLGNGDRTGRLDARVTRANAASQMHPPFDDPSMTLGTETGSLIAGYLQNAFGYAVPSPYRTLNLGINFKWKYADHVAFDGVEFAPYLVRALSQSPDLKVFTSSGYYDITTPAYEGQLALDQAGVPLANRTSRIYKSGHSVFEDETQLARLSSDLRAWSKSLAAP